MAKRVLTPEQYKAIALMVAKDVNGYSNARIAQEVGVSPATIYNWKKDQGFTDELIRESEQMQRAFIADTYAQLRGIMVSPNTSDGNKLKAVELFLKNQGRLKDVQEQTVIIEELSLADMLKELNT